MSASTGMACGVALAGRARPQAGRKSVARAAGPARDAAGSAVGALCAQRRGVTAASAMDEGSPASGLAETAATAAGLGRRRALVDATALAAGALALSGAPREVRAAEAGKSYWEVVDLNVDPEVLLLDVGFVQDDPAHGFLLGTRQTLLETFDGGKTWEPRVLESGDDLNYRFNNISFSGSEGWVIGKPSILLHTTDGGKSWERVPLSNKLPGTPVSITALGGGKAEMATDEGAIYFTDNEARTWKALVKETISATLNRTISSGITGASYYEGNVASVKRSSDGSYVGVSSRGNFYLTWTPGDEFWTPHNRANARRIQGMGFRKGAQSDGAGGDSGLYMLARGGALLTSESLFSDDFTDVKVPSRGYGLLDLNYKLGGDEVWISGGSGTLLVSLDGGKTWARDRTADSLPANLYVIKFVNEHQGYALGNAGTLLRYVG